MDLGELLERVERARMLRTLRRFMPEVVEEDESIRKLVREVERHLAELDIKLSLKLEELLRRIKEDPDFLKGLFTGGGRRAQDKRLRLRAAA